MLSWFSLVCGIIKSIYNQGGHLMSVSVNKLIAFFYWLRNVSFALQAVLIMVSLLVASSQDQEPWIPYIVNHPLFGWLVFLLIVAVVSTVTIEHLEKK